MTVPASPAAAPLDAEWARVGRLVALAESLRTGDALPPAFGPEMERIAADVAAGREAGAWSGLAEVTPEAFREAFVQFDLDLLAMALAPDAAPALAPRLHSLQPQVGGPYPSLPLLQELLMLDGTAEVGRLFSRLDPAAPLCASGLLRVAWAGDYQVVRPSRAAARAALRRPVDLSPPPGAHLSLARGRWDDLVVPEPTMRALKDFTAWVRRRDQVRHGWGARPLPGPLALFSGRSGVGKSFAAAIIAGELSAATGEPWALYCLDLGRILSKYVGETEQNLNALLDALHGRRAILQIDEADGLLGKRGEVSDARDRYANLEVSHLLSRVERHEGPVILTTNLRTNIDAAFLRRFQLVVDFPAPEAADRERLWRMLLPPLAPREDEVTPEVLAETVRLTGGAIHNAAVYAAVLAAEEERPLALRHVARAVWSELRKDNRQVRQSEIGMLARHLEEAA